MTRWSRLGLVVIASLAVSTACSKPPVLGVLLPISGSASTYGKSMSDAMHLALDEAQQKGEVPAGFKAFWADSASDPATGVKELKVLAGEDRARFIIGGCTSDVAKALLPLLKTEQVVCLSPSASAPELTKKSKLFYRLFPSDELEGTRAGTFLYQEQGKRKVLIFSSGSEHARGIEPEFRHQFEQNLGGKVVARILLSSPNWKQEATDAITAGQPAAAYVIAYAQPTVEVLRFLRRRHFRGTICVTSAFYNRAVLNANKKLVEGVFLPLPSFDPKSKAENVQAFVTAYRERFGVEPDIFAAHAYDAMRVALYVLKNTKYIAVQELQKTLQFGLNDFQGVTGVIRFDDYGDVHHNPIIYIVKNGAVLNFERYRKEQLKRIREEIMGLTGG